MTWRQDLAFMAECPFRSCFGGSWRKAGMEPAATALRKAGGFRPIAEPTTTVRLFHLRYKLERPRALTVGPRAAYIPAVLPRRAGLFTTLAVLTVAAVNAAGLWSIGASRRAAAEEAARLFRAETEARGRALATLLAGTRADLAFLAGSPLVTRVLPAAGTETGPRTGRDATEAALLLFLRAHPEVTRLEIRAAGGTPLVLVGRRGGIPILWVASNPTGAEGPAVSPARPRVAAVVPIAHEGSDVAEGGGPRLEAEIAPSLLLGAREPAERPGAEPSCVLLDRAGRVLARHAAAPGQRQLEATASVTAEGWTAAGEPWRLSCAQSEDAALAFVEPVAARSRTTLALNLGAMGLAVLLGLLAVREVAQRERLEARAREEARVRDLERQLFHAERLTTAGRLAAGIAHEINNPLEGMANYLSLARGALERGDVEAARRRLESVRQGLERAALVVRQVLAHADPAKAPRTPVDLNRVLAEATEFVRSRPEFASVRFETALAASPLMVEGNPIMLGQVALNLIVNACEAQPGGGEVRVSSHGADGAAEAEVADRGPGIAAADRDRIFEPFFSTKNSTGLGLSICHSIVRQHGGRLEALARADGGTIFRLTLPTAPARTEVA
jgi:two-component system, NtrC family, sensor kinase